MIFYKFLIGKGEQRNNRKEVSGHTESEAGYSRGRPGHLHGRRWSGRGEHGRGPLTCATVESTAPTTQIAYSKSRRVLDQDSTLSWTIPQDLTFLFRSPGFPQFQKFVIMDIDDILREVDPVIDTIPSETRDLQALTRAWVAERCAPELLECATLFNAQTTLCSPSMIRSNAFCC